MGFHEHEADMRAGTDSQKLRREGREGATVGCQGPAGHTIGPGEVPDSWPHCALLMQINFGQIYLSKPLLSEADDESSTLFPKEARLRNLT